MAVNKVVYNTASGAVTLIDLTGDTVTPETLAEGVIAHDASGNQIIGTATNPEQICVTRQITISTDQGNGTATTTTVLSADEFVKKHYNKTDLSITMIPLFTPVAESTAVHFIWHGNRIVSTAKSSYYGLGMQSSGTSSHTTLALNTAPLTGNTYAVGFRAKSNGDVQLYTRATSIVKAGNYMLILTCT